MNPKSIVLTVVGAVVTAVTLGAVPFDTRQIAVPRVEQFDVVLSNGRVIDPETRLDAVRNVGIKDGHVAAVSATPLEGRQRVDATGLVVAPGFIDWHAHGHALSLPDAIAKTTYLPAKLLEDSLPQMKKKGRLQVGMDADVVVFDPATVQDRATYERPNQTSVGMRDVLVNGTFVIRDGVLPAPIRARPHDGRSRRR